MVSDGEIVQRFRTLEDLCRRRGIPLTMQRLLVLEVVLRRGGHPTADEIFAEVRRRSRRISKRTVYRVLETLAELGLIRRVPHPGSITRFDAKLHRHHHLICTRCAQIQDLESPELDGIPVPPGRPLGFEIQDFSVQLTGLCPACQPGSPSPRPDPAHQQEKHP